MCEICGFSWVSLTRIGFGVWGKHGVTGVVPGLGGHWWPCLGVSAPMAPRTPSRGSWPKPCWASKFMPNYSRVIHSNLLWNGQDIFRIGFSSVWCKIRLKVSNIKEFRIFFSKNNKEQMIDISKRKHIDPSSSVKRTNLQEGKTNAQGTTAFQVLGFDLSDQRKGRWRTLFSPAARQSLFSCAKRAFRGLCVAVSEITLWGRCAVITEFFVFLLCCCISSRRVDNIIPFQVAFQLFMPNSRFL